MRTLGPARSLTRHFSAAYAVAIELLVVMHGDAHPQQTSGEFERRVVMRNRAAAVAADVEAGPRDQIVESELGLQRADRFAVDQQGVGADSGARALGRRDIAHQPLDMHAEPMRAGRDLAIRDHDLMAAADIEVVHQKSVLDVEAIA